MTTASSFAKITELLPEFQPRWTVAKGIEELASDMRRYGLSSEDFEGPRYVRLARVRELVAAGALDDGLRLRTSEAVR